MDLSPDDQTKLLTSQNDLRSILLRPERKGHTADRSARCVRDFSDALETLRSADFGEVGRPAPSERHPSLSVLRQRLKQLLAVLCDLST